jgi:hypothetical protein
LVNLARKSQISRHDVFMADGTSINCTLPTIAPIFDLSQSIVKRHTTSIHSLFECLLLSNVWIDAIAVVKCQHPIILERLLGCMPLVNIKPSYKDGVFNPLL